MIKYIGDFWSNVYGADDPNHSFIEALNKVYTNQEFQSVIYADHINNALSRDTVSYFHREKSRMVLYREDQLDDQHYIFNGELNFDGAYNFNSKPSNIYRLPLPEGLVKPAFITDNPANPTIIMQEGIDFLCSDGIFYMKEDIRNKGFELGFDQSKPPKRTLTLWFLNAGFSDDTTQRLYGDPIKAATYNSSDLVNIYWDMLIEGCSDKNIRRLLCIITDTDYLDIDGKVEKIFVENKRNVVVVNGRLFSSPEITNVIVNEGDIVHNSQFLFNNAKLFSKDDEMSPSDFPIMHLSEAMIGSDIKGGVCIENKDTDIPGLRETLLMENVSLDAVKAMVKGDPVFLVSTSDGYELIQYNEEPYTEYTMVRIVDALPFRGTEENINKFLDKLNSIAIAENKTILDILIDNSTTLSPSKLNLFNQYRNNLFGTNAVFVSIMTELIPDFIGSVAPLAFVKRVLNAGTSLLTFFESDSIVDYSMNSVSDSMEVFLVPEDISSETFNSVSDSLQVG